jgi:hypothetical protein
MHIEPSRVPDVELIGPDAVEFGRAIEVLMGGAPDEVLKPALPFSVIVRNNGTRPLVLLGVRFDMVSRQKKPFSVVHYADTLRYPERASLGPGALRFVCAERRYTDMVLRRAGGVDARGAMNLENLAGAARVAVSLDCVAFSDGQFAGPDSHGAFHRFGRARDAESGLVEEVRQAGSAAGELLAKAIGISGEHDPAVMARRTLAKEFHAALAGGELVARVANHRLRIPLWRGPLAEDHGLR